MAIAKLNEAMLYNMGFDRVAIDALRHLLNQVGGEIGAQTLPEVVRQVDIVVTQIDGIDQAPLPYMPPVSSPSSEELKPPSQQFAQVEQLDQQPRFEHTQQMEFLETQVRSLAEQLVSVSRRLRDIEQGASL